MPPPSAINNSCSEHLYFQSSTSLSFISRISLILKTSSSSVSRSLTPDSILEHRILHSSISPFRYFNKWLTLSISPVNKFTLSSYSLIRSIFPDYSAYLISYLEQVAFHSSISRSFYSSNSLSLIRSPKN